MWSLYEAHPRFYYIEFWWCCFIRINLSNSITPKQKSISNTIDKELEKGKEKQMLAFYIKESKELVLPNLDVYTSLLFSLIFFFFLKKRRRKIREKRRLVYTSRLGNASSSLSCIYKASICFSFSFSNSLSMVLEMLFCFGMMEFDKFILIKQHHQIYI